MQIMVFKFGRCVHVRTAYRLFSFYFSVSRVRWFRKISLCLSNKGLAYLTVTEKRFTGYSATSDQRHPHSASKVEFDLRIYGSTPA